MQPRRFRPGRRSLLLAGGAAVLLCALPFAGRLLLHHWEENPVLRGRRLATANGCFACHLPFGGAEIENPGSRWGTVPRFEAGNVLMYAKDVREVEQFIRDGAPASWRESPGGRERLASQHLRMPAYGDRLATGEIADLVAFVVASEELELDGSPEVAAGRALARKLGCQSCHGPEGGGGIANPGSLGGFVPGFLGHTFNHLVRDRAEFDEWVRTGTSRRLAANPVVRWFWARQALAMPAYESLGDQEVDQLWAWVQAARRRFEEGKQP